MMSLVGSIALVIQLLAFPIAWITIDAFGACRSKHVKTRLKTPFVTVDDFTVLVPIYGSVDYLRNIDLLRKYPGRVWLLTTTEETGDFNRDLAEIADRCDFRILASEVRGRRSEGSRATSGAMRDTLVRDALGHVKSSYVVCIDADTTVDRGLEELVSTMVVNDLDFASLKLVPTNTERWLGKLQAYEYRVAMRLRLLVPWLVSGACHAARTEVHRDVMRRHSLFFQGNDVEAGVLATRLGYRVGHVPFDVLTDVPDNPRSWFRQRLAWAGGEFRLFAVNANLIRCHVWMWAYGLFLVILALPLRWLSATELTWSLLLTYLLYLALSLFIHRGNLDRWVLLLPVYAAFSSLVMAPLGVFWYFVMAHRDRNVGVIRLDVRRPKAAPRHRAPAA